MNKSSSLQRLKEYANSQAAMEPVETVGFVYYDEQWCQFIKVVNNWEEFVAGSPILTLMNDNLRYQAMVKDMNNASAMAPMRGNKGNEHRIICEACKVLLEHLGKLEAKMAFPIFSYTSLDSKTANDIFATKKKNLRQLFEQCRPYTWQRGTGFYNKRKRKKMLADGLGQIFSDILQQLVKLLHQDYSFDGSHIAKNMLFCIPSYMEELWNAILHSDKDIPSPIEQQNERNMEYPPLSAEEMARNCFFFFYYWKEPRPYNDQIRQEVRKHLLAAKKFWATMKQYNPNKG